MKNKERITAFINKAINEEMSDTEYYIAGASLFKEALIKQSIDLDLTKQEIRNTIKFHTSQ